jgi:SAM-dependent methyltransferase
VKPSRSTSLACLWCLVLMAGTGGRAHSTSTQDPYKPTVGQEGKDVVWVPTTDAMVQAMLDHAQVTSRDLVIDLGSGDGRMIIAAAQRGARGLGVEYNPDMVAYAKQRAEEAGVSGKAAFVQGDMYEADISKATVLALFLLPANLEKLVDKFLALPPGTRIVANTYWVSGWEDDDTRTLESDCESWCTSRLFIVPARAEGTWRMPGGVLSLTQRYQVVEGTYTPSGGEPRPVSGRLRGRGITVTIDGVAHEGTLNGEAIVGAGKPAAGAAKLTATRVSTQAS